MKWGSPQELNSWRDGSSNWGRLALIEEWLTGRTGTDFRSQQRCTVAF
jgi:hypothetical protein